MSAGLLGVVGPTYPGEAVTCQELKQIAKWLRAEAEQIPTEGRPSWCNHEYVFIAGRIRDCADLLERLAATCSGRICEELVRIYRPVFDQDGSQRLRALCQLLDLDVQQSVPSNS